MWALGLDEGLGLPQMQMTGFLLISGKELDFGEINYAAKQPSRMPTTHLKVKLLE